MKKLSLGIIFILFFNNARLHTSAGGAQDNLQIILQALAAYNTQLNISAPNPNTIVNTCVCPVPPQVIPIPLPNFLITMQNSLGGTINSFTFPTNVGFLSRIAILTVTIFPPSTEITSTTALKAAVASDNSYAIVYTLASPDGLYMQSAIQYPTSFAQSTFMPIANNFPSIPITMNIFSVASGLLLNTTSITASFAGLPVGTQQQLLNSICPITQKFLITTTALGLLPTATSMSGSYNPNSNTTTPALITSVIPSTVTTVPPLTPTDDAQIILPITITLYNGTTPYPIIFQHTSVKFNQTDLINGLDLNLFIYPPLYLNGSTATNFIFVATLQTLDGLKFRKLVYQTVPFTNYPITFTVTTTSLEGQQTILTSNIANPLLTPQIYNMISPINLRMRLQQDAANNVIINIM
ncbi:hypothetical protein A3J41_02050 [candidate division TM6 bacterium RIFCSPHIGHO2_12_FULL_38_8]|nr:MAG: hypothetical protein A3J41_02050 [candidate division TM6 bacterium RIFCSPHIGHO2_12_FULL_38_8]